jgi:hypothetical protein
MNKRKVKLSIIIAVFIVIILYGILTTKDLFPFKPTTGDTIQSVNSTMHIALIRTGKKHPISIKDVVEMYQKDGANINYQITEDGLSVKDEWGMPIIIEFTEPSIYKFTSYGANRKDDNGEGDDIYAVYDLSIDNYMLIKQKGILVKD